MPFIFGILLLIVNANGEDFITPFEYGKMLYQNPRGIGCDKCHGLKGKGKVIAYYKDGNATKKLLAPPIYNLPKKLFLSSVNKKSKVMPTYFLTKDEIKSLYFYINEANKPKK